MEPTDEIFSKLAELATDLGNAMGADPAQHGMLRGTAQAALAEAQGCAIPKDLMPAPGSSLQSIGPGIVSRGRVTNTFEHSESLRGAALRLLNLTGQMEQLIGKMGSQKVDPQAVSLTRQAYQPIMTEAYQRIDVARQVEQATIEIYNSGNGNRLSGVEIIRAGRDEAALVESQLGAMTPRWRLLPPAVSNGNQLMSQISRMSINADDAKDLMKQIADKTAAITGSAVAAARAGGAAARSWIRAAYEGVAEFVIGFGSRLSSFPIFLKCLGIPELDRDCPPPT